MREMTIAEIAEVSGGVAPVVVAAEMVVLGYTAINIGYNFCCGFWDAL